MEEEQKKIIDSMKDVIISSDEREKMDAIQSQFRYTNLGWFVDKVFDNDITYQEIYGYWYAYKFINDSVLDSDTFFEKYDKLQTIMKDNGSLTMYIIQLITLLIKDYNIDNAFFEKYNKLEQNVQDASSTMKMIQLFVKFTEDHEIDDTFFKLCKEFECLLQKYSLTVLNVKSFVSSVHELQNTISFFNIEHVSGGIIKKITEEVKLKATTYAEIAKVQPSIVPVNPRTSSQVSLMCKSVVTHNSKKKFSVVPLAWFNDDSHELNKPISENHLYVNTREDISKCFDGRFEQICTSIGKKGGIVPCPYPNYCVGSKNKKRYHILLKDLCIHQTNMHNERCYYQECKKIFIRPCKNYLNCNSSNCTFRHWIVESESWADAE